MAAALHSLVLLLRCQLPIWPSSLRDKRISNFPMFPLQPRRHCSPLFFRAWPFAVSKSRFPCGVNVGSSARSAKFKSLSPSPPMQSGRSSSFFTPPIALQCYPAPVVADGIDTKFETKPIALLWIWPPSSAIPQSSICSFLRMLLRSPPTLTSSTRVVSSDLPPRYDHSRSFP